MAAAGPQPVLVGLHIGKTGGTTLHDHVRGAIDHRKAYYRTSPHEDFRRVVSGRPLIAELSAKALARIKFAAGHNLPLSHAFAFSAERLRLFTIIRDPFDRFVSQYKQYLRARSDSGAPMTARAYFDQVGANSAAKTLHQSLGAFVDDEKTTLASTTAILGNLDYVLLTERLDDQGSALMALVDLPPLSKRTRVYPEVPDLEGLTREEVAARNPIDSAIASALQSAPPELGNPFAHDRAGRFRARAAHEAIPDKIETAYRTVLAYMDEHLLLRPARIIGAATGNAALVARVERYAAEHDIDISAPLTLIEETKTGSVLLDLKKPGLAAGHLLRVTERDRQSFVGHYQLAVALAGRDPERALQACRRAVELNDTNEHARGLLERLST